MSALPSAALQVAAAASSSYAMLVDGSVWAWGRNGFAELGDGQTNDRVLSPVQIEGYGSDTTMRLPLGGATAWNMFVIMADGTAKGSGRNNDGQLGNGGWSDSCRSEACITASAIPELGDGNVQIARGGGHTLVLKRE